MKLITLVSLLVILAFSSGCTKCDVCVPKTITVKEVVYVKQAVQSIADAPIPTPYNVLVMEINGEQYYAMNKVNAAKAASNWESYKGYTNTLRNILVNLQSFNTIDSNTTK